MNVRLYVRPNGYRCCSNHFLVILRVYFNVKCVCFVENLNKTINRLKGKFSVVETKAMQFHADKEMQQVRPLSHLKSF